MSTQMDAIRNYQNLVEKVDEFSSRITAEYANLIYCKKGCDNCCRNISIFPVEAFSLAMALRQTSSTESAYIRELAHSAAPDICPLLDNGACLLYQFRPIICRTHGIPLLISDGHEKTLDFCPKNFIGISTLPSTSVMNLDLLNATLSAINGIFLASCDGTVCRSKDRFSIAEALLLDYDTWIVSPNK
jgi:uncharacterized protein